MIFWTIAGLIVCPPELGPLPPPPCTDNPRPHTAHSTLTLTTTLHLPSSYYHRIHQLRGCYVHPASSYTMIQHNRTRKHFNGQMSGNALQVLFFTIRFFSQERLYQLHWSSAWTCKMTKRIFPSFYFNMAVVKLHFLSMFLKILRTIPT